MSLGSLAADWIRSRVPDPVPSSDMRFSLLSAAWDRWD